jgi:hypothetical protein
VISEQDRVRARGHMGYLNGQAQSTFVLGVPAGVQTQFVIEGAFNKVLPQAEHLFRKYLDHLDQIEAQIVEDTENVAVTKVDEISLRDDELVQLVHRYKYWQGNLANLLGVPPNPFDQRPMFSAGWNGFNGGINVMVNH